MAANDERIARGDRLASRLLRAGIQSGGGGTLKFLPDPAAAKNTWPATRGRQVRSGG